MGERKKVTEAQMRATANYEKKAYDKVLVRLPKGTKERIANVIGSRSLNGFIVDTITEKLEKLETNKDI